MAKKVTYKAGCGFQFLCNCECNTLVLAVISSRLGSRLSWTLYYQDEVLGRPSAKNQSLYIFKKMLKEEAKEGTAIQYLNPIKTKFLLEQVYDKK